MKKLPIGQQHFENLRLDNCIYVDKTACIHRLMNAGGSAFFLSRPRRFGKSLLLSTIQAVFEGKKELFGGLYIEDKIDWEPYPVLMLDMSFDSRSLDRLEEGLRAKLLTIAEANGLEINYHSPSAILSTLIDGLYLKTGKRVVVLVDEYDKPILDVIHDIELANAVRQELQAFYTVLKSSSSKLKFLMVSGITKVSQTSIFSGFNNLNDISLDTPYSGICGYTQEELEHYFAGHIRLVSERNATSTEQTLADIKYWYNGYSWDAATFVYNPYSVLLLLDKGRFKPFWYSTGTPTFLLKLLKEKDTLERVLKGAIRVPETFTEGQRIELLNSIGLLFQAGYLTIKASDRNEGTYFLDIPNEEVNTAISELMLMEMTRQDLQTLHELAIYIREGFQTGDTAKAIKNLDILLANTTYNTHQPNKNESHYQALFQLVMILSGIDHRNESMHRNGRTDAVLLFEERVYIVELKYAANSIDAPPILASAMQQIRDKSYATPYLNQGKKIHLLSLVFTNSGIEFLEETF